MNPRSGIADPRGGIADPRSIANRRTIVATMAAAAIVSLASCAMFPTGGMLFVNSGYAPFAQMPGNLLLAFGVGDPAGTEN